MKGLLGVLAGLLCSVPAWAQTPAQVFDIGDQAPGPAAI
jgi:hypothetical protein